MTDSLGFLDAVASLPEQLAEAHRQAGAIPAAALPSADGIRSIVVLGMGGSGIAGDVLAAAGSASIPVPVLTLKQMRVPAFVGPDSLAFAISYSGDTEETLAMARDAIDHGARLVAVSRGGALRALAEQHGALHIGCPDGLMPRAALGALVAPLFVTLKRIGLFDDAHTQLLGAQAQLAGRRDQCHPQVAAPRNPARELARRLDRTFPLIYGGGALGSVAAYRWKCDVNENAKAPAYCAAFPELDHNEICAWGQHGDVTRQLLSLVQLRHGFEHERLGAGIDATLGIIEEALHQTMVVEAEGEGRLAQLLDLMYMGDWVSCYLALDNDVDPGPIPAIADLKAALAR